MDEWGFKTLEGGQADIWFADLRLDELWFSACLDLLSEDELSRMHRFHFERHRRRYAVGRATLRCLLAKYYGVAPASLKFCEGPAGKPVLSGAWAASEIQFNVAHCEDLALFGITRGALIGVDVEQIREIPEADHLVRQFFCPEEANVFSRLPPVQRPQAFFNLWTRKEALLKATGEGVAHSLNRVEVSLLPEEQASIRKLPPEFGQIDQWSLVEVTSQPKYAAAVAVRAPALTLRLQADCRTTLELLMATLRNSGICTEVTSR